MTKLLWRVLAWRISRIAKRTYGGPGSHGEWFNSACWAHAFMKATGYLMDGHPAANLLLALGWKRSDDGCHWHP